MIALDHVRVQGPDATGFLQGQLSQDVAALAVGAEARSFVLEPTGKVCAWLTVHRHADDGYTLAVDRGWGATVLERLQRFKLRTKVDLVLDSATGEDPGAEAEAERIAAGTPRMGAELVPGRTIPAEAGQAVIDASVSFTKGCYTGQELVARIDSRGGNVPRHLRRLVIDSAPVPPAGATIEVDGKEVGAVTSAAWSATRNQVVALGYVARSVAPPAAAQVRWEGSVVAAGIEALPR
jgi:tRNA-modifying protein YgfZ